MHYRKPDGVESKEIGWREGAIVGGLVACIVALAVYPQLVLNRADAPVAGTLVTIFYEECWLTEIDADPDCFDEKGLTKEYIDSLDAPPVLGIEFSRTVEVTGTVEVVSP
jgi:hypothetical protein